ncbi:MAG: nicotinate-nucleotide--dimethylbenzimidazole phosphoribosyltransferase [Candidatus Omnitrophota bacterium]|nr:nicotinate-nucleotide--dimethylbenzimidazole phosphoribosyltransferase [Candidatus Omnitrophota bacterium]
MELLNKTISRIEKIDYSLSNRTQKRLDNLTKPQGSLGRLEELAKQVVEITRKDKPELKDKVIFTFAADHGVTEEGISAYPKEVTAQMVYNFIRGGAGINVLARQAGAKVVVADLGVAEQIQKSKFKNQNFIDKKIGLGTKNFAKGPAMTKQEAIRSIESGMEIFLAEFEKGIDIAGIGEMGIGNTASASAISAVITDKPVKELTGRGTGIDDKTHSRKIEIIEKAIALNKPQAKDAIDVLAKVGGFEIGGLAGVVLAAASKRVPVVMDGFISTCAALLAYVIEPKVKDYLIASHCSVEKGHKAILEYLGLKPILDLSLRLGEGTGAALAMPVIEAGVKILTEMATFQDAGVSESI